MAQLSVTGLHKSYGSQPILRGVSLEVAAGEFMTIVGPSGCGKSTMLRIVAGLEDADDGSIAFDGQPVGHLAPKDRDVAMVFQSYALYPHKTVRENIAVPLKMRRLSFLERMPLARFASGRIAAQFHEIDRMVEETAGMVGLGAMLARRPAQLSGGQRQRVAIARAVVRKARLTLMDEPFSSLDTTLRLQLRDEVVRLHKLLGNTILFVTHDATEAMTLSDRIAVMTEGRILQTGRPQDLYADPGHLVVARLLGQSNLNTLQARWQGGELELAGLTLHTAKANLASSDVIVGFRPEALRLQPRNNTGQGIAALVTRIIFIGCDLFVELRTLVNGALLLARCLPHELHNFPIGAPVAAHIAADQLLVFDPDGVRRRDCVIGRAMETVP